MNIKELLLKAPDTHLDPLAKDLIQKWTVPPKAIEILEVLDQCIYQSLASNFTISTLQILYDQSCNDEGITHDEVVKLAVWRNEDL